MVTVMHLISILLSMAQNHYHNDIWPREFESVIIDRYCNELDGLVKEVF